MLRVNVFWAAFGAGELSDRDGFTDSCFPLGHARLLHLLKLPKLDFKIPL